MYVCIRQVDPSDRTNETDCHKFASVLQSFTVFVSFSPEGRLPAKWTAYEALQYGVFTTQTDV